MLIHFELQTILYSLKYIKIGASKHTETPFLVQYLKITYSVLLKNLNKYFPPNPITAPIAAAVNNPVIHPYYQ